MSFPLLSLTLSPSYTWEQVYLAICRSLQRSGNIYTGDVLALMLNSVLCYLVSANFKSNTMPTVVFHYVCNCRDESQYIRTKSTCCQMMNINTKSNVKQGNTWNIHLLVFVNCHSCDVVTSIKPRFFSLTCSVLLCLTISQQVRMRLTHSKCVPSRTVLRPQKALSATGQKLFCTMLDAWC